MLNETGLTPQQLSKMTPFEQAGAIKPHLDAAGRNIARIADDATQAGKTLDIDNSIQNGLASIDDPMVRQRALQIVNRVAQDSGLDPGLGWKAASPNAAVNLRQELWSSLPSRYRGAIYGSVTGDLKAAVPDLAPADQTYSELRAAVDATKSNAQQMAVTAPESGLDRMVAGLKKNALPIAAGAAGSAAGIPALGYFLRRFFPASEGH